MTKIILVVDDDADSRDLVKTAVSMMGHAPYLASDGQQGLAFCRQMLPDLLVVDYMMPGMTGTEVCRELKKLPGGELVPVIMLTARDNLRDKVLALEEGVDDYLTKPYQFQELQARITAQLRVRDLNMRLHEQNLRLQAMQEKLVEQERELVVGQLAGTAAHQLGQPLSAILLNCYLLESLPPTDERSRQALQAVKSDAKRMAEIVEQLRGADPRKTSRYFGETSILELQEEKAVVE
jgi:DNA-binding response OmpR family regulator